MKILFIGGTGNISLTLSKSLLNEGHQLTLLNRSGYRADLEGANFLQADAYTHDADELLKGQNWDVVVNWVAFTEAHVQQDIRRFNTATKQYIFISSASCYKKPCPGLFVTEDTPLENPFWQYSRDKIACEKALVRANQDQHFPVTIVRPSHTYSTVIPITIGGWDEYTAIDRIKAGKPILVQGDGTSLWTITHASDFAIGFKGLLGCTEAIGEAFHITSDEVLTWNEIYQQTAEAIGCEAKIVHVSTDEICRLDPEYIGSLWGDKSFCAVFDNSKIKRYVPEFEAKVPYREGIKQTIRWFEADKSRQKINVETETLMKALTGV